LKYSSYACNFEVVNLLQEFKVYPKRSEIETFYGGYNEDLSVERWAFPAQMKNNKC